MIHNLLPKPTSVKLTYDIDFVPDSSATARSSPARPLWMDVSGLRAYPVFDALKGQGKRGKLRSPTRRRPRSRTTSAARTSTWRPRTRRCSHAGHLHPGGLYTDLKATRGARPGAVPLEAKYFEPAGAVSWDVSMTATKPSWKIAVKAGDRLNVSATYDTRNASWYESMGIMVIFVADGIKTGAKDPFKSTIDWRGKLTHGHLPENDHHGGKPQPSLRDAHVANGSFTDNVMIQNFLYGVGDFNLPGKRSRPPLVRAGQSITFTNLDATTAISARDSAYHTITACKAPCTGTTGIAYPLANAKVQFDSGELGFGPRGSPGRQSQHVVDPEEAEGRDLHLLLPHPPVHARLVPRRRQVALSSARRPPAPGRRASCMPPSIPESMIVSRSSLLGHSTSTVSVVRPSLSVKVAVLMVESRPGQGSRRSRSRRAARPGRSPGTRRGRRPRTLARHHHPAPLAADPQIDLGRSSPRP